MATESTSPPMDRIVVQGTGYVGLPAALLLADAGFEVIGVDVDENVVKAINEGVLHLDEAELQQIMERDAVRANLRGVTSPVPADAFVVAVPTPLDHETSTADLSILIEALDALVPVLAPGNLVIIESTVPPGTCRTLATEILERSGLVVGTDLELAHCPERILPGNVFREIVHNDRIIGCDTSSGRDRVAAVYATFVEGELMLTDLPTAELAKLVENASRDVAIAFANEVAEVALGLDVDPTEVIALANRHPRVDVLTPGIGVGGHCIPIDPWFIVEADPANSSMIRASRRVNDARPGLMTKRIVDRLAGVSDPLVCVAGVTYKPDCEDVRESPALEIIRLLEQSDCRVSIYDPLVPAHAVGTLRGAAHGADLLVVLVPHTKLIEELEVDRAAILEAMRVADILSLP